MTVSTVCHNGIWLIVRSGIALLLAFSFTGCATSGLNTARSQFNQGNFIQACETIKDINANDINEVLLLTERGSIRQAYGDYEGSSKDWERAIKRAEALDYYSVTKGTASFVVNNNVMAFSGAPFERTLLHALNAHNYMARSKWDEAAVEARNIAKRLENLNGFPDDSFSRYLAGFCFEMIGDADGARIEYNHAAALRPDLFIDDTTGQISSHSPNKKSAGEQQNKPNEENELVCFILMNQHSQIQRRHASALGYSSPPEPYAQIYSGNRLLGRSYALSNTKKLLSATDQRLAAIRATKDVARVVVKDSIANAVSKQDKFLGELVRLILFALEAPDNRHWETLPIWLEVARVKCPSDLKEFTIVFKNNNGTSISEKTINTPITRKGKIFVSFCRDLPEKAQNHP